MVQSLEHRWTVGETGGTLGDKWLLQ